MTPILYSGLQSELNSLVSPQSYHSTYLEGLGRSGFWTQGRPTPVSTDRTGTCVDTDEVRREEWTICPLNPTTHLLGRDEVCKR